jgi:DNA-binding MarR family transcriptional regulator
MLWASFYWFKNGISYTIELTETGKGLARDAPPPIQQKIVDGLKRLSEVETDQIVLGLTKLTNMLDVQDLEVE